MPLASSRTEFGVCGANRTYRWSCPESSTSTPALNNAWTSVFVFARTWVLPQYGLLKEAMAHVVGWAARSCTSQLYCGDVAVQPPTPGNVHSLLSAITCQLPTSKL